MATYPKMFMSITELKDIGLPERMIREIAHMRGAKSVIRKDRKFIFDTRKLDADIELWQRS